nr:hypothetical protein [Telluribacter sp. SYSU D00476]
MLSRTITGYGTDSSFLGDLSDAVVILICEIEIASGVQSYTQKLI